MLELPQMNKQKGFLRKLRKSQEGESFRTQKKEDTE